MKKREKVFVIVMGILIVLFSLLVHFVVLPYGLIFIASLFGVTVTYWYSLLFLFMFYVFVKVLKNI